MKKFLLEIAQGKRKDFLAVLLAPALYLLSLLYGIIVRLACFGYRAGIFPGYKSRVKVISVGNITLGGTGKTPFVKYLAQALSESGKKVVVLSRGYGLDEVRFLEANLPGVKVFSGRDRIRKVKEIERDCPCDLIILDDGFQHWRLKRDLDIVLLNSREYLGNRKLIPRGVLREPAASLKRADIIVLSKADMADNLSLVKEDLRGINPAALTLEARHQPRGLSIIDGMAAAIGSRTLPCRQAGIALWPKECGLSALKGKKVCLLSGIADPDSFNRTIISLGADIALDLRYPDHYNYKKNDIADIVNKCRDRKLDAIITTEKDLTRLSEMPVMPELKVWVLKIELKITENERLFFERIHRVLAG